MSLWDNIWGEAVAKEQDSVPVIEELLLQEDGFDLLQENGDKLLLE